MRSELVAALLLCGCSTELEIGIEHRVVVTAAVVDPGSGELLEAGHQLGDLWYGRARADGTLVRSQRLDVAGGDDALSAAVALPSGGWAVAGWATTAAGARQAWVRALDAEDREVWTTALDAPAGREWSALTLAADPEQGLLVGGLELGGAAEEGWLARLGADGALRWRRSFATDFAAMASGFRPHSIGTLGQSYRRVFPAGRRTRQGLTFPGVLDLTLDGDLFNSGSLGTGDGTAVATFVDPQSTDLTFCLQREGDVVVRSFSRLFDAPLHEQVLSPGDGAAALLGACALTSDAAVLLGYTAVYGDGRRVPHAAVLEAGARSLRFDRALEVTVPTTALGVAADSSGGGWLVGWADAPPSRRWAAKIAPP